MSRRWMFVALTICALSIYVPSSAALRCKKTYSCKDCHTSVVCIENVQGRPKIVNEVRCPSETPFCSPRSGTCTNKPQPTCGTEESKVTSASDGIILDDDCTVFHNCTEGKCYRFECGKGLVYNPYDDVCDKSQCGAFKCDSPEINVAHSVFPRYYSDCQSPPTIHSCLGDFEFNHQNQTCEAVCRTEGIIQDLYDCQKYHVCSNEVVNGVVTLVKHTKTCLYPSVFDPTSRMCGNTPPHNIVDCKVKPDEGRDVPPTPAQLKPVEPPEKTHPIAKKGTVECLSEGLFPTDTCTDVLMCEKNMEVKYYECEQGLTYNSQFQQCLENQKCGTFACYEAGEKVPHTIDPSYYIYCDKNKTPRVVDQCSSPYQLNATSQRCELTCRYEGAFRDPYDCNKYFLCKKWWIDLNTVFFEKVYKDCPAGQGFDHHNFQCVTLPSQWIPECGGSFTPTIPPTITPPTPKHDDNTKYCIELLPDICKRLDLPYSLGCTRAYMKVKVVPNCQDVIETLIDNLPTEATDAQTTKCLNLLPGYCRKAYLPFNMKCTRPYMKTQNTDGCSQVIKDLVDSLPKSEDPQTAACLKLLPENCQDETVPFQTSCTPSYIDAERTGKCTNLLRLLFRGLPENNVTPTPAPTAPPITKPTAAPTTTPKHEDTTKHCIEQLPNKCKRLDLPFSFSCTRAYMKVKGVPNCQDVIDTLIDNLPTEATDAQTAKCLNLLPDYCRKAYLPFNMKCTRQYMKTQNTDGCSQVIKDLVDSLPTSEDPQTASCLKLLPDTCQDATLSFQTSCTPSYIDAARTGKCTNLLRLLFRALSSSDPTSRRVDVMET